MIEQNREEKIDIVITRVFYLNELDALLLGGALAWNTSLRSLGLQVLSRTSNDEKVFVTIANALGSLLITNKLQLHTLSVQNWVYEAFPVLQIVLRKNTTLRQLHLLFENRRRARLNFSFLYNAKHLTRLYIAGEIWDHDAADLWYVIASPYDHKCYLRHLAIPWFGSRRQTIKESLRTNKSLRSLGFVTRGTETIDDFFWEQVFTENKTLERVRVNYVDRIHPPPFGNNTDFDRTLMDLAMIFYKFHIPVYVIIDIYHWCVVLECTSSGRCCDGWSEQQIFDFFDTRNRQEKVAIVQKTLSLVNFFCLKQTNSPR